MGVVGDLGSVIRVSEVVVADAAARRVADKVDLGRAAGGQRSINERIEVV